jgi:hypothetical protein
MEIALICKIALAVAVIALVGVAVFEVDSPSAASAWPEIHSPKTNRIPATPS